MDKLRILILYPKPEESALLASMLKSPGYIIDEAANDRMAVRLMERENIDLVLAGVDPDDSEALELLAYARRKHRDVPVVLLFMQADPVRAKEALRLGAMAVLKFPVPAAELRAVVLQALERCESRPRESAWCATASGLGGSAAAKSRATMPLVVAGATPALPFRGTEPWLAGYHEPMAAAAAMFAPSGSAQAVHAPGPGPTTTPDVELLMRDFGLVGNDRPWRQVVELAAAIASSRCPVLIVGEPGTGKSRLARLIHDLGPGPDRPFITCEAAALAEELSADESDEPGQAAASPPPAASAPVWAVKINLARGGTLHIDDVADLPLALQHLLLLDLQFTEDGPTPGDSLAADDVRLVVSTSEHLRDLIEQGRFCQELFHRISVVVLSPPPLRHRRTDVELLAEVFRERFAQEFHKPVSGFSVGALDILQRHDWPGNVRELEAAIQRAVAICKSPRISSYHLAPILNHRRQKQGADGTPRANLSMGIRPLKEALEKPEMLIIIQTLRALNGNRQETARILNISRTTLYKKMKKYGLLLDEPTAAN